MTLTQVLGAILLMVCGALIWGKKSYRMGMDDGIILTVLEYEKRRKHADPK